MVNLIQQRSKVALETSINSEALKAFVESCKKPTCKITIGDFYSMNNFGNHEMWRKCRNCGDFFDLKNHDRCPTCQSKKFKK
jgi:Zn finger protein HypA/HybF involved in hydrogenase expression